MVPYERSLVSRLAGRPFALLGVSGDADRGELLLAVRQERINWRSWFQGGPDGPVTRRWGVEGWPTVVVLDARGVIRYRETGAVGAGELDPVVNRLLAEAERN